MINFQMVIYKLHNLTVELFNIIVLHMQFNYLGLHLFQKKYFSV